MSDNFVGFAQSPKLDPLREVQTTTFEFESQGEIKSAIQLISTEAGLSSWLGKLAKFDFRQGAKLKYGEEAHGATFALIQIPKRFVIVAETLGEVDIKFREQKSGYRVSVSVKRALLAEERAQWEQELGDMRNRIKAMRQGLRDGLKAAGVSANMDFITSQIGMFSYSGLTKDQMVRLRTEFGIYGTDTGRMCVAAMNSQNIDYVCKAIAAVL